MSDDAWVKKAVRENRNRFKKLAAFPIVNLVGHVPESPGAGQTGSEKLWTMDFDFSAWRIPGGPLRIDKLRIIKQVNDKQLEAFQKLIDDAAIIQIRARLGTDPYTKNPVALLTKFVGNIKNDAELNAHRNELLAPVTVKDKILGTFTLNRRISIFETKAKWLGRRIRLSLDATKPDTIDKTALTVAHTLWREQKKWNARIRQYAVKKLLPLKNDNWLGDKESPLTATQFDRKVTLDTISIHSDGCFDFWHNDGDLFWGHTIQITANLKKGPYDADIPG